MADEQQAQTFNATDPKMKAFMDRGGKLIVYHGWSDAALPPLGAIKYFSSVQAAMGADKTDSFMRLFMVPGMQHCGGGPGANAFGEFGPAGDAQHDLYQALEQWVEKGLAPDKIIAKKFVSEADHTQGVKMTRPLCPYPQSAKYKGTGDTNDAANFACVAAVSKPGSIANLYTKPPRALYTPEPKYSKSAAALRIEGIVVLSVIIGVDGHPYDVKVVKSLEPSLDANAIETVKMCKFEPAVKDGKPIAVPMNIQMSYKLY